MQKKINIRNKKARFEYEILDIYTAGIQLTGTEIKSIRESKARIPESFCEFNDQGELFVINIWFGVIGSNPCGNSLKKSKNLISVLKI